MKALIIALILSVGYLAVFHIGRYVWILDKIRQDGGVYLFEPSQTMLYSEIGLGYATLAMVLFSVGYCIGVATK